MQGNSHFGVTLLFIRFGMMLQCWNLPFVNTLSFNTTDLASSGQYSKDGLTIIVLNRCRQ